ncbi:MAG TPA: hypothetical protein VFQ79_11840 [Bryobacteraceae bacterium]|nr:hypothetical protein [Bryobacteraceae bacterium]
MSVVYGRFAPLAPRVIDPEIVHDADEPGLRLLQPIALLQEPEQAHETARDQIICVGRPAAAQDEVLVQGIIMLRVQLLDDPEGTPLTAGTVTLPMKRPQL